MTTTTRPTTAALDSALDAVAQMQAALSGLSGAVSLSEEHHRIIGNLLCKELDELHVRFHVTVARNGDRPDLTRDAACNLQSALRAFDADKHSRYMQHHTDAGSWFYCTAESCHAHQHAAAKIANGTPRLTGPHLVSPCPNRVGAHAVLGLGGILEKCANCD